ncbi:hypothetical protein P879_07336 [Paragonimus westermani]|uniref:LysM domain-containing protein n=1 Tax=Paragonimus westermani TaxID=34504 RepID=A0A8T0DFI2_9TREM|nr:hypothetical protein P879_07336 [Paragonimus westermani]
MKLGGTDDILNRSKSLYDGTKHSTRFSNIKSKLKTVSSSIASSSPFSKSHVEKHASPCVDGEKTGIAEMAETKNSKKKSKDSAVTRREDQTDGVESARRKQKTRRKAGCTRLEGSALLSAPTKSLVVKPQCIMEYEVQPGDTLSSVAVRYQSTPSELYQVNRLFCRSLFPGQIIKVPKAIVCEVQRKPVLGFSESSAVAHESGGVTYPDAVCCNSNRVVAHITKENSSLKELLFYPLVPDSSILHAVQHEHPSEDELTSSTSTHISVTTEDTKWLSSSASAVELEGHVDEENDPMAARYMKFPSDYVTDLRSMIPGSLLVTTDSLLFIPMQTEADSLKQFHLLLPLSQLRSVAVYRDHSVMYFTKRDKQSRCSRSRRATGSHAHSMSRSPLTSERSLALCSNDGPEPSLDIPCSTSLSPQVTKHSSGDMTPPSVVCFLSNLDRDSCSFHLDDRPSESLQHNNPLMSSHGQNITEPVEYLCVLANTGGTTQKRHANWFTLLSNEYWFRIPEEKSYALFDFLQSCEFQESTSSLDTNEINQTSPTGIHGWRSSPACMFQTGDANIQQVGSFVVVTNSFDWVLPRIGSVDERSKALMKIKQQRKHRAQSVRENTRTSGSNSSIVASAQSTGSLDEDILLETIPPAEAPVLSSAPSLEEEKTALQILKQESVRWEWLRRSVRQAWHHFTHWLVHSNELGLEQAEARKRQFILDNLKLAVPELLPLPPSTSTSHILDPHKVRQVSVLLRSIVLLLDTSLPSSSLAGYLTDFAYRNIDSVNLREMTSL